MNSTSYNGAAIVSVKKTLTAAATGTQGGWQNTTGYDLMACVQLDVTTASTGAATLDIGVGATDVTGDKLIDGVDVNAAAGVFASPSGTNGRAWQKVPAGYFVSAFRASGDPSGMVADLYVTYYQIS